MILIVDHVTPKDEEDSKEVVVKITESIEADRSEERRVGKECVP